MTGVELLAAGALASAFDWQTLSVISSIVVAVGTLLWAVVKDRGTHETDLIDKALSGLDSLVGDLQQEREALTAQVRQLREDHADALQRESLLIREMAQMRGEMRQLRYAVEVLETTLKSHGIPVPSVVPPT